MKKLFKNYKQTLFLLIGIIIGGILGAIFKEDIVIISPLGDLFLNLLLIIIVPLIFLSITVSVSKMGGKKRLGKILVTTFMVFAVTSIISVLIAFGITSKIKLVDTNHASVTESLDESISAEVEDLNLLERTVDLISVNDFSSLLSKENMIALMLVAILFGFAINKSKEKGEKVKETLESFLEVVINFINIIMWYAPIGLGAYFATLIGTVGTSIATGYLLTFALYLLASAIMFFVVYTLIALVSGGKKGVKSFWKNIIPSSLTALGTCSSAASVPVNITCTKNIGVPEDIAETTVTLGTSFHKDGSSIGSVFKIMFLVSLFGTNISTFGSSLEVLGISLLATLLVSAVPIGGGTISEMMIITMMGYPVAALPILTIIATVIDAPATLLNVVGDSPAAMLSSRIIDGKNWMKNKKGNS